MVPQALVVLDSSYCSVLATVAVRACRQVGLTTRLVSAYRGAGPNEYSIPVGEKILSLDEALVQYKNVKCLVYTSCEMGQNTFKLLERLFDENVTFIVPPRFNSQYATLFLRLQEGEETWAGDVQSFAKYVMSQA